MAKAQLKQRWGTMRNVLSSQDRLQKIVADILLDMETRDRLQSGRGNALLVSSSIYSACRIFEMFQTTDLAGKCAIVTSYKPSPADTKGEDAGEGLSEKLRQYEIYRKMLADHFDEPEDTAMYKVERFEQEVKKRFVAELGQMKLLIVVDKLLTGFDAPPATYLYIDKHMQDHGLFQAICRVNRLDGEDKEYGYIIDYKDLFQSLKQSIENYTGEAFDGYDRADVEGLLKSRLEKGRERLDEKREVIRTLCEAVESPRDTLAYVRYFCAAESGNAQQLKANERIRVTLYKMVAAYIRAYANLANEMCEAGYSDAESQEIKAEVSHFEKVRKEIKLASGDYIDMKMYEPAMRHLLDTYIRAEESEVLSAFDDLTLVELIVERGELAFDELPEGLRDNPEATAEAIENNVRRLITDEMAVNPKYYEKISLLLDALILQRKQGAIDYKAYLEKVVELTKNARGLDNSLSYPSRIDSIALRSIFDNLESTQVTRELQADYAFSPTVDVREEKTLALDHAIREVKKADWRGNRLKEREVRKAIESVLDNDEAYVTKILEIVKAQRDY